MPLSDEEQQILQDIERRLYEQDPEFARGVASSTLTGHLARNIRRGLGLFAAGLALLIVFFIRPLLVVGIASFLLMLAAATYTFHNVKKAGSEQIKSLKQRSGVADVFGKLEQRLRDLRSKREQ
ncbi:MAG: DUF3040 domain-containing protein [Actinomycetota bacterium]